MGQAKARGSFEQRQIEGAARLEAEAQARAVELARQKREAAEREAALPPEVRARRRQASLTLNAIIAMALSGGQTLPFR
jgi:hypothetical protein